MHCSRLFRFLIFVFFVLFLYIWENDLLYAKRGGQCFGTINNPRVGYKETVK